MSVHMTVAQATYKLGAPCPNCGSENSEWNAGADLSSDRNRAAPIAYLACTDCSETLTVRDQDWIEDVLNRRIHPDDEVEEAEPAPAPLQPGDRVTLDGDASQWRIAVIHGRYAELTGYDFTGAAFSIPLDRLTRVGP